MKNKQEKPVELPVGKANKKLDELYKEQKQVPFHTVSDIGLKMQRNDYAQLQAWGQKNNG